MPDQLSAQSQQLAKIHTNLSNFIKQKANAFPSGFNQTRFIQNALSVLQDTPEIDQISSKSIARTMLKGAFLGLDFFNKECYAIPYNKNIGTKKDPTYIKELQFQTDYKGEIKLIKKYSIRPVKDVYAKIVHKGDDFEEIILDGVPTINFTPKPFNDGEIIGAFAVCLFEDGGLLYETMSTKEIEVARSYSKIPNGPAWTKSWGEMGKKAVERRLCKGIPKEFQSIEASEAFEDGGDAEFVDFEDVKEEPIAMPAEKSKEATTSSNGKDTDKLGHILDLLHAGSAGSVGDWLEKETSFKDKNSDKMITGKRELANLTEKQRPFVFRAARKELVEKADRLAVELYPEKEEREKALAGMAEGLIEIKDMHTADQIKVYEILLNLKLDKQAKATEAK